MSRRSLLSLAAAAACGGCSVFETAFDRQLGRAFGESEADFQRRRDDQDRAASLERTGMSREDAARMTADMRANQAALESGNAFKLWK